MPPPARLALLAAAAVLTDGLRRSSMDLPCVSTASDLVAYALMTQRVCEFNFALDPSLLYKHHDISVKDVSWKSTQQVAGCWNLTRFNTDSYMTTAVYRNGGRCVLAISGYHASANGLLSTITAATEPKEKLLMCDNEVHAPVVRQFWNHTASANWSKIVRYLGGPKTPCREVILTGDSMGGSVAPLMAACASQGQLDLLHRQDLPDFKVSAVYTFGAFAAAVKPFRNASSKDGCIRGKRIFHSTDVFAQWAKSINMKHAYMDAIMLSEKKGNYSYELLPCTEPGTVNSDADVPILSGAAGMMWAAAVGKPKNGGNLQAARKRKTDGHLWAARKLKNDADLDLLSPHAITHYVKNVRAMTKRGTAPQLNAIDYANVLKNAQL